MNDLSECIRKYNLSINKIEKKNNYIILYGKDNKYLLKEKDSSKKELFNELSFISYPFYLPQINDYQDSYELYFYYEDNTKDKGLKMQKLIDAISLLHQKTMVEETLAEEEVNEIYEKLNNQLKEQENYFEELQYYIESFSFPRVDYYYLINNITLFYKSIWYSKDLLEKWHQLKSHKMMKSFIIGNCSLENFKCSEKSYFINLKDCHNSYRIDDLISLYKTNGNLSIASILEQYQNQILLTESEELLLSSIIGIPEKIVFQDSTYQNTVIIKEMLDKINNTFIYWSEKSKENQETNEEKLEE